MLLRLIDIRGDLLMTWALRIGRLSEAFERLSKSLHQRAMSDLARSLLADDAWNPK
jgi:hypothetical protein